MVFLPWTFVQGELIIQRLEGTKVPDSRSEQKE